MPQISFVMPTKNRGYLIRESIQSIVSQTVADWELIIVDAHSDSTDKTEAEVKSFNDTRIKYIKMPDGWTSGIAAARNFGNMFANSPIIAVTDSDDIYKNNRAELTINAFKEQNCDVFYGRNEILDKTTGEMQSGSEKNPVVPFSIEKLREYNFIPHGSTAYKTEIAYNFPYNSFFQKAEDYDLFMRLATTGKKFYFCDEVIFTYVMHGRNIMLTQKSGNFGDLVKLNQGGSENRESVLKDIIDNSDE